MPVISGFYGIVIFMNYREHEPPHFHATYQDYDVSVGIKTGTTEGKMPKKALRMMFEWSELHQDELLDNWGRARKRQPLNLTGLTHLNFKSLILFDLICALQNHGSIKINGLIFPLRKSCLIDPLP
jgi:hypothetical protein